MELRKWKLLGPILSLFLQTKLPGYPRLPWLTLPTYHSTYTHYKFRSALLGHICNLETLFSFRINTIKYIVDFSLNAKSSKSGFITMLLGIIQVRILGLLSRSMKVRASDRIHKKMQPENIDLRSLSNLSYWLLPTSIGDNIVRHFLILLIVLICLMQYIMKVSIETSMSTCI